MYVCTYVHVCAFTSIGYAMHDVYIDCALL